MERPRVLLRFLIELGAACALLVAAPLAGDSSASSGMAAISEVSPRLVVFEDFSRPT
ncbi:MAG: hypothetical protein V1750_01110 [Acidobacteriota bacterium]